MDSQILSITKKSTVVFIGKIFFVIFGFLFNFIAARYMGAKIYGKFVYLLTFATLLSLIVKFGFDGGLTYFLPRLKEKNRIYERNSLISFSLIFSLIFGVLVIVIIFVNKKYIAGTILNNNELEKILVLMLPILILRAIVRVFEGIFRGINDIEFFAMVKNIISPVIKVISLIIFLILGFNIYGLIYAYYIYLSITVFLLLSKLIQYKFLGKIKLEYFTDYKNLIKFSFPILFSGVLAIIVNKTDTYMIGYFLTDSQVGIYNISYKIAELSSFVHVSFNMVFPQIISSYYSKGDIKNLHNIYINITKWSFTANLISFFLILLCGEYFLRIFGNEYTIGLMVLLIMSVGQVVRVSVGAAGYINTMTGKPQYQFYNNLLTAILNIFLNYLLIPKIGIEGAAIASLVSVGLTNIIRLFLVYKDLDIHPYNFGYIKVILICTLNFIIMCALKEVIILNGFFKMIIIILLYLILFLIFYFYFALSEGDKIILDKLKLKIKELI